MAENFQSLPTLGEDEERSNFDISARMINRSNQQDDMEPFEELDEIAPTVKTDANKFRMLCDHVTNSFTEIDNSMFELLELKDNLLLQFLPANVSTRIALVVSRLYRAYSLSQIPIYELVRLAQLYSQPFDMKSVALKKLYDNNEIKKRMLNIALQKITSYENSVKRIQELRCVNNWERMYIHLALPRSNVRKWKFRLKTFRETSQRGYEHVIEWIHAEAPRFLTESGEMFKEEPADEDEEPIDNDQIETSGDYRSVPETDEHLQQQLQHQQRMDQGSDFGDEIESDNDGSFLSSAGKQRVKQPNRSSERKQTKQIQQEVIPKVDAEIQVKPDLDDQQTSTGDILSTKSLIMRIYRPVGLLKTKFQCIVHAQGKKYTTVVFVFEKTSSSREENTKGKGRLSNVRSTKAADTKTKKQGTESATPDGNDINTIDKNQFDELIIAMPTILKRRSLFETEIDPDAIQIDLLADEKLCGSLVLSPEDLRMLDLPNLNSPTTAPLVIIDDSNISVSKPAGKSDQFDFDSQSNDVFKLWISRMPQTFTIYNDKRESVAKLPLHLFWYNKVEITHATKCTMTAPLEVRVASPKIVHVPHITPSVETNEKGILTNVVPPVSVMDESTEPSISRLAASDEHVEIIKATYEDKIAKIHENYQAEIRRLTKLLSESVSRHSSQLDDLLPLDGNVRDVEEDEIPNSNTQRHVRIQGKREIIPDSQPPITYGKNLPKNFLDRYKMFLERSAAHRQQLTAKVEQEIAQANERQMEIQHRLHKPEQNEERYDDLCLPAVFMPFRSGNVFNPRAYRYFHSIGSADPRLTQTPSVFKLPPLPSGSVSVLNLFELSRCYEAVNEKDRSVNKTTSQSSQPLQPPAPPTTQTSN